VSGFSRTAPERGSTRHDRPVALYVNDAFSGSVATTAYSRRARAGVPFGGAGGSAFLQE
jgi:hypothetical protein